MITTGFYRACGGRQHKYVTLKVLYIAINTAFITIVNTDITINLFSLFLENFLVIKKDKKPDETKEIIGNKNVIITFIL